MEASAVPRVAPTGVAAFASPGLLRLLSDDRLVALVRDGNTNAFEALYDRHHRAILSFCRHMLGGADEAEDAVQHTFLSAYKDLVSSSKSISLRAWLFTIARNRCLSILRARHDHPELEFEEQPTDGLTVEVQRRQDLRDLVGDINQLPDDQRAALVLAEIGALSHAEIGSVIGVPKVKVKALVFQARESLLASRAARETDCHEIREQLATMRGGALRRTTLRRHLRECQGCREYRREVEGQRRRIAVILPVIPTIALRDAIFGATAGSGVAGAGLAGGGVLGTSSLVKGVAGKALVAAMLAAAGTTGTILVAHDLRVHPAPATQHRAAVGMTSRKPGPSLVVASPMPAAQANDARVVAVGNPAGRSAAGAGVWSGHEAARTKALVHSLTGQLSNFLSPVSPRTDLPRSGSGGAERATHPAAGGNPAAAPVLPGSTGVLLSQPVPGQPGASGAPAAGSTPSAPPPGQPGSGPTGLSTSGGAPVGGPTGSGPSGAGSGSGGNGSTTGSGSTGSGSGSSGSGSGSGSGSSGSGGTPAPGSGGTPTPGSGGAPSSTSGSASGSGAGSGIPSTASASSAGTGSASSTGSPSGAGTGTGSSATLGSPAGSAPA